MPNTTSAKKALRQSVRRKARNVAQKTKYKAVVKEFRKAVASQSFDKAKELLPKVYKVLDKSSKINTIKANKASRLKSRLVHSLSKATAVAK